MSYFHDTSEENAYYEALEEQELQDYAWEMVNYKIKKEAEEKAAMEKEKAEALEKERKEREKIELEAKYPKRNFVYDEIFKRLGDFEGKYGSGFFSLEKNEIACAAFGESNSSIDLSFEVFDFVYEMMFSYDLNFKIEFFHYYNHVKITLTFKNSKNDSLMKVLGYEDPEKTISFIHSEKDLTKKYHDIFQEIKRSITKATSLTCIKEYVENKDVLKRLIFHFWNNATCIQDEDAEFDDTEIMKPDYVPQEYYCGRHLGLIDFHQEWIDQRLYREKNSIDPECNAFVKTNEEFPDIFPNYDDYEEDEIDESEKYKDYVA